MKNTALELALHRGMVRHPEAFIPTAEIYVCPFCLSTRSIEHMPGPLCVRPAKRPTVVCRLCDAVGVWGINDGSGWSWIAPSWEVRLCG